MTNSHGYRSGTRKKFSRGFRKHGFIHLSSYLTTYKIGDYVDVRVNAAQQKGMPHKSYHGKTGVVFDVTPHALGIEVNKRVRGHILKKRLHVRVEHVVKSRCNEQHLRRVQENAATKARRDFATPIKRSPAGPLAAAYIAKPTIVDVAPVPYEFVFE